MRTSKDVEFVSCIELYSSLYNCAINIEIVNVANYPYKYWTRLIMAQEILASIIHLCAPTSNQIVKNPIQPQLSLTESKLDLT